VLFLFLTELCPLVDFPLSAVLKWVHAVAKEASPKLLEKSKTLSKANGDSGGLFEGTRLSTTSAILAMLLSCHAVDFPSFVQQLIGELQDSWNQVADRSSEEKGVSREEERDVEG
jgi:hypothetical protein